MPEHLQPYGFHQAAGMGFVVCSRCGGSGRPSGSDAMPTNRPRSHPVVWFFGLNGALFAGVLKPLPTDWFVNAVLGFVVVGMGAGFLMGRSYGRIVLALLALILVGFFGLTIYMAETGQMGN